MRTALQHHWPEYLMEAAGLGRFGAEVAFVAEVLISFVLMSVVLRVSNNRTLNRFTGLCAGLLVAELYVRWHGAHRVLCAKLHHHNTRRCIFHCGYAGALLEGASRPLGVLGATGCMSS